jgi:hypothetical protein
MMSRRAVVELLLAFAAAVGCVLCWRAASYTAVVAPVLAGEPETHSEVYLPPLLALALLLAAAAGVLAVLGVARWRRAAASRTSTPASP